MQLPNKVKTLPSLPNNLSPNVPLRLPCFVNNTSSCVSAEARKAPGMSGGLAAMVKDSASDLGRPAPGVPRPCLRKGLGGGQATLDAFSGQLEVLKLTGKVARVAP